MKFWQKKKTFDVSETDQVYKVIYLGNVVTSWAKGEHTLEKPLTALWRNYCNNYASYHIKNDNKKPKQVQNKQILMKLTICNQGLKALTREFGLTEYWANRITFCGQNSNFPRVFAWIYRHEAKQKKQELRVHACFVSSQSNVNKMISTLQQKVNFALNEFKREKRLRENARKILSMNESLNLDDDELGATDRTDAELFNEFVDNLYAKMHGRADGKLKDDLSITSSERTLNCGSASTSKNSTLDKKITRNPSQGSLNSLKSKSSTSSKKSINYDSNLMPVRSQFLVKGLKNFKEPIERSRSAPKLSSIVEEFVSSDDDEREHYFDKLNFDFVNRAHPENNLVWPYNQYICEEEPDDEEIIRELGLISGLTGEDDKTLTEFNEDDLKLSPAFNHEAFTHDLRNLSSTIYEENEDLNLFEKSINHLDNLVGGHVNGLENGRLNRSLLDSRSECDSEETNRIKLNGKLNGEPPPPPSDPNEDHRPIGQQTFSDNQMSHQSNGKRSNSSESNDALSSFSADNRSSSHADDNNSEINSSEGEHTESNTATDVTGNVKRVTKSDSLDSSDNTTDESVKSENVTSKTAGTNLQSKRSEPEAVAKTGRQPPKAPYLYSTCQSPSFIIVGEKMRSHCDHTRQIIENCKLIEDLVLNF